VEFAQLSDGEWGDAVLFAEDPELVASIDVPGFGAGNYQPEANFPLSTSLYTDDIF